MASTDLADENTLVSFDDLARRLLTDPDGQVRLRAIRLLQENDDPKLAASFLKILADDDDAETRREAASALGHFVELGELERDPGCHSCASVEDALLEKVNGERPDHRPPPRPGIAGLLLAPGSRHADPVLHPPREPGLAGQRPGRHGALLRRALGGAGAGAAAGRQHRACVWRPWRPPANCGWAPRGMLLFQVLEEEDEDQVSSAAIWSLSQIGGEDVRLYIQNLLDAGRGG